MATWLHEHTKTWDGQILYMSAMQINCCIEIKACTNITWHLSIFSYHGRNNEVSFKGQCVSSRSSFSAEGESFLSCPSTAVLTLCSAPCALHPSSSGCHWQACDLMVPGQPCPLCRVCWNWWVEREKLCLIGKPGTWVKYWKHEETGSWPRTDTYPSEQCPWDTASLYILNWGCPTKKYHYKHKKKWKAE